MAGITLAQAEAKLAEWMAADTAVASGQSYSIDNRTVTKAQALEIRNNIKFWDEQCRILAASPTGRRGGRPKVWGATPV